MCLPQNPPSLDPGIRPDYPAFFSLDEDCCRAYRNARDLPHNQAVKDFVELLWARFQPSQDPNFLSDARHHFLQRFWEMYLFVSLQERGLSPKKGEALGPDFYLEVEGRRYWIEAIAPDAGDGANRVPGRVLREAMRVPKTEIILRYTSALAEKRGKWLEWLKKGIVSASDGYIVSINGRLCDEFNGPVIPLFIEAFLPFGPLTVMINKATLKAEDCFFQHSDTVLNKNQAPVSTAPLLEESYAPISAVLHSLVDPWNHPKELGGDFELLHNPKASTRLLDSSFLWCLQQHFVEDHLEPLRPKGSIQDSGPELVI